MLRTEFLNRVKPVGMPLLGYAAARMSNNTIKRATEDLSLQSECIIEAARRFHPAVINPFMNLSIEPAAFGCETKYVDDNQPPNVMPLINGDLTEEIVNNLNIPSMTNKNLADAIRMTNSLVWYRSDQVKMGYILGPFSLAATIRGHQDFLMETNCNPEPANSLVKKCNEFLKIYAEAILKTGVDALMILEPWSGSISPAQCEIFSNQYVKQIVDIIKGYGVFAALHNCHNIVPAHAASFCTLGIDMLHVGTKSTIHQPGDGATPLDDAIGHLQNISKAVPDDIIFSGNLPAPIFAFAEPDAAFYSVMTMLTGMRHRSNFIVSSACDVPSDAKPENVQAFFEAVRDFYREER